MVLHCPHCSPPESDLTEVRPTSVSFGTFFRKSDRVTVSRFQCLACRRTFSEATFDPCYGQNKRHLNQEVADRICDGASQRRIARRVRIHRKTVERKILFLARMAKFRFDARNLQSAKAAEIQFDDMETLEHTKCKPLSITVAVEASTRRILSFKVSRMPAKGTLAAISRKKYGPRKDERGPARRALLEDMQRLVEENAVIKSDKNPHYPPDVRAAFPKAKHLTYKGRKAAVTGQGELKVGGKDPIFSLNHTCAMFRDNLKRLHRKNWCTTKRPRILAAILQIYAEYHNSYVILNPAR